MQRLLYYWILFVGILAIGQQRSFVSIDFKKSPSFPQGIYEMQTTDGAYYFQFLSPHIVETSFVPKKESFIKESHAVIVPSTYPTAQKSETAAQIQITYQDMKVVIQKNPLQIKYYYQNELVVAEKKGFYQSVHVPMETVKGNIVSDSIFGFSFQIEDKEKFYGGGARALGMNRRGHRLPLFNRAHYGYETEAILMNFCMPIAISSKKYLLHFDNPSVGYLDLDSQKQNELHWQGTQGKKTYQVIFGKTWQQLLENYTEITGKQPMPPIWVLGNFSSRFGYRSEIETKKTIAAFEEANIPVDAVILDLFWFGKTIQGTMGNLEVDRDSFPNWEKMMKDFNQKGIKTIPITEPFILTSSKKWEEAVAKNILATNKQNQPYRYDFYFGNTGLIDIFKPTAKQWFWDIYKSLAQQGASGVWGDLGEPEVHPHDIQHINGNGGKVHNIYGHEWAKTVFQGYQSDFPETRPFILMRSGYSGSQRYGMIPWSGDVNRTWGGLQKQIEISLQMGMQGMGYMHSDLGGFAGANLDDELYVRWLQYGVFNPIFRPHAQEEVASEPVFRSIFAKQLAKEAIELRYKILPYNYQLLYENHTKGWPLMRPFLFAEPENEKLFTYDLGYLWGDAFAVFPIKEAGLSEMEIYLPKGNWVNFYTNKIWEGGKTHTFFVDKLETNENKILQKPTASNYHLPTFVKTATFIPMNVSKGNTSNFNPNHLEIHFYIDQNQTETKQKLFFDDGLHPRNIENGTYEFLVCEYEKEKKGWEIEFKTELGSQQNFQNKTIEVHLYLLDKKPKRVRANGKKVKFNWDPIKQKIKFKINHQTEETEIKIK